MLTRWQLFSRAARFRVLPVMVMPILIGAAGAFSWYRVFHPFWFFISFIGASAMHLFSNMINDLWDYRNGIDTEADQNTNIISTHSGILSAGIMSERSFAAITWTLFSISLICGIVLTLFRGPWVILYGGLGALLAYFYVAPPIRYGYRGKGYSEAAILLSFGVLPVLGSCYVQTAQFDWRALIASLPIGMFTTLILFNHHFLHWQADQSAGKRTLVVVLGERRALIVSRFMLLAAFLLLIAGVLLLVYPAYALLALFMLIRPWRMYRKLNAHNESKAYLPLMASSLQTSIYCGTILTLSLTVHGIFGI